MQGQLKLFRGKTPFRFLFNEQARTQLPNAIFKAARSHKSEDETKRAALRAYV